MKKIISIILVLSLTLSILFACLINVSAETLMLGDINNSKDITAADALMALQFSVEKINLTDAQKDAADVDNKDGISASDALCILQYSVEKISKFPRTERYETLTITEDELKDKIAGSWVGEMAGVAWGASTEFQYCGVIAPESTVPEWEASMVNDAFSQDDLYVEIPFIQTMVDKGVDCTLADFAESFKNTTFGLAHANYQGRANLLNGISAPDSGSYLNNYHADDIDWQIESDFLGSVYPGLVNEATQKAFEIGHIMNYGDGVYGGVFVTAMQSAAYTAKTLDEVIAAGVNAIPENTKFRNLLNDIMTYYAQNKTWEQTWQFIQDKWGDDDKCPEFSGTQNIDAKLNAGYVLMGLLYGNGDFTESMEIAMRCGQDSDCNPSTVGGILGKFYGLSKIPDQYKSAVNYTGNVFSNTDYTLNKTVDTTLNLAKAMMEKSGFTKDGTTYTMNVNTVVNPVTYEQWPDDVITAYLNVKAYNDFTVDIDLKYVSPEAVDSITIEMGDGKTFNKNITKYQYEKAGTYTIICTVKSGTLKCVKKKQIIIDGNSGLKCTAIVSNEDPQGGGSRDISVISDGYIPDASNANLLDQYDTFPGEPGSYVWFGLTFERLVGVQKVYFYEGSHFQDGGWYSETPRVQLLIDGVWVDVASTISPEYPKGNTPDSYGSAYECYTFTLNNATVCGGLRINGKAGGNCYFASCSEIKFDFIEASEVEPTQTLEQLSTPIVSVQSPAGGGSKSLSVISDGIIPSADSLDGSTQYDTYVNSGTDTEEYFGYLFDGVYEVSSVTYTDGIHYDNGGWFKNGTAKIQAYVNGQWIDEAAVASPEYPSSDDFNDFKDNFKTFKFTLNEAVICTGIRIIGSGGGSAHFTSCSELSVEAVEKEDTRTIEQKSQAIVSVQSPVGGGNKNLYVICDGITPSSDCADGSTQYDTYSRAGGDTVDYYGYLFKGTYEVSSVTYTEGIHYGNGGWFKDGTARIQAYVNGVWTDVATTSSPAYPNSNTSTDFGNNFETYTFTLNEPVTCIGIRIIGSSGGGEHFTNCAELSVAATEKEDVRTLEQKSSAIVSTTNPLGGGSKYLYVISDGIIPSPDSNEGSSQYDTFTNSATDTEEYFGYLFDGIYEVTSVTFTDGMHYGNGGWFKNGTLKVQVFVNGKWTDVETTVEPVYPNSDDYNDFINNFQTYTFTLNESSKCKGVRIIGTSGGGSHFVSCSELSVGVKTES